MGNSDSFDLIHTATEIKGNLKNSGKKKLANAKHKTEKQHIQQEQLRQLDNSIASFDLNGIFRRLGDDINQYRLKDQIKCQHANSDVPVNHEPTLNSNLQESLLNHTEQLEERVELDITADKQFLTVKLSKSIETETQFESNKELEEQVDLIPLDKADDEHKTLLKQSDNWLFLFNSIFGN